MIFTLAGRILDVWLAALPRLRTAWRAGPGDLLGLLVMQACGARPTRQVAFGGAAPAVVVEDPRVALYLDHQAMGVAAQTLGRYVFARVPLDEHTLGHEIEHIRQWQRLGPLFLPLYGISSGIALALGQQPYFANAFEAAARARADGDQAAGVHYSSEVL